MNRDYRVYCWACESSYTPKASSEPTECYNCGSTVIEAEEIMDKDTTKDDTEHEFVFYLYEQDDEDPRFSFWLETDDGSGMSLYERPPDGQGMWLKPSEGSDHDAVEPTDELKQVIAELMDSDVNAERVHNLDPHERHFVQVVHGTINQNADAIPNPVWGWMHDCAEQEYE